MKSDNICKFVPPQYAQNLTVKCFVRETNFETMRDKIVSFAHHMMLVTGGNGKLVVDKSELPFTSNTLVFVFKDEEFYVEPGEKCEYMYIRFDGARSDELFRRFNIHKSNRAFTGFDSLVPLWKESLLRADEETLDLASESILYHSFSRLKSAASQKNTLFHKVLDIVEKRFNESSLSLGSVADELSYSPKYISNIFKKEMKMGFSEYIRTLRIKYAVTLFDHGIDSVKNVAFLSGFTDPLYFSTVFKTETGVSPKEYIRNMEE